MPDEHSTSTSTSSSSALGPATATASNRATVTGRAASSTVSPARTRSYARRPSTLIADTALGTCWMSPVSGRIAARDRVLGDARGRGRSTTTSPSASSVPSHCPSRIVAVYALSVRTRWCSNRVAAPTPSTSTPVAIGSSVPAWPTRRVRASRRIRATTSCDVSPAGLSTTTSPSAPAGRPRVAHRTTVGTARRVTHPDRHPPGPTATPPLAARAPAPCRRGGRAMNAVSPAHTPPSPQCQCSAARLSGANANTAGDDRDGAQEADVAGADQHAVEGEHHAGRGQHARRTTARARAPGRSTAAEELNSRGTTDQPAANSAPNADAGVEAPPRDLPGDGAGRGGVRGAERGTDERLRRDRERVEQQRGELPQLHPDLVRGDLRGAHPRRRRRRRSGTRPGTRPERTIRSRPTTSCARITARSGRRSTPARRRARRNSAAPTAWAATLATADPVSPSPAG